LHQVLLVDATPRNSAALCCVHDGSCGRPEFNVTQISFQLRDCRFEIEIVSGVNPFGGEAQHSLGG
jgi:hypothetical protein